jgi:M6 family metalloprotease-like protein
MRLPLTLLLGLFLWAPAAGAAQDVEMLGERHGTQPPQAYFDQVAEDPLAFQFVRGRAGRRRAEMRTAPAGAAMMVLGPRDGPVVGTVRIPVVLGLFSDSPDALSFTQEEIADAYFGAGPGTISAFYDEVSGGRVSLEGELHGWVRSTVTRLQATGGESGLVRFTTGTFIMQLLAELDGVDWGPYDNDGPDGVPNSGDDDGFVDALGVLQPTAGAECGGADQDNRIWSHRWNLQAAAGATFTTGTAAAGGGFIQIDDYTVQPVFACNEIGLSEIGVFTHELGHAFGLPDLYDTDRSDGTHGGAGRWSLMASGSWGCNGDSPESPCHMDAWSKATLGWGTVTTLDPGMDHGTLILPPVETSGAIYRVDAGDGSGEYFLLENRSRLGFDEYLHGEGLLIWQIDPATVQANWWANEVNAHPHMGVWLRQADGYDELGQVGGGRGDRDDPFPYVSVERTNDAFHAGSNPGAHSYSGTATGLTVLDIERLGDDMSFRLLTRFSRVSVSSVGDGGSGDLLTVDGESVPLASHEFESAPFQEHTLAAKAGEWLGEGLRRGFEGWEDDDEAPRERTIVTPLADAAFVARYEGLEVQLSIESVGGLNGVSPGSFSSSPASEDLWFPQGASVLVEAVPQTGFGFVRWTGDLAGEPNPAGADMGEPVFAGAEFELTYRVPNVTVTLQAATSVDLLLEVENETAPVFWSRVDGVLPPGLFLNPAGRIAGAATQLGTYPVRFLAADAIGLSGEGIVTFQVDPPVLDIAQLASDFLSVGPPLTSDIRKFLDGQGNQDNQYDLGDFRAWVLAHPELPLSATLLNLIEGPASVVVPIVPVPRAREGGR